VGAGTWLKGRRGEETSKEVCGNESCLLVGGLFIFLHLRFNLVTDLENEQVAFLFELKLLLTFLISFIRRFDLQWHRKHEPVS